ncbi:hypothetical protein EC3431_3979 [Escherichia coli 3431]|nr:hypothetical protein EC3431_3979 [Escherichia coli 3431]
MRPAATFAHCLTLYCDNCYAQKQQASLRMPVSSLNKTSEYLHIFTN